MATKKSSSKQHGLTTKQQAAAKRAYKKLGSQKATARSLGVAKWRVNLFFQKKKVGKRAPKEFDKDVRTMMDLYDLPYRGAQRKASELPKYSKRRAGRAGKKWKSYEDRQAAMRKLRDEFGDEELTNRINKEMEDYMYGDTPH